MKKIISLLLCVLIILLAFCACSSDKEEEAQSSTTLKITYDSAYSNYNDSIVRGYESVCNAIINGDDSVKVNTGMRDNIQQLLYTSFPLVDLIDGIENNDDNSGFVIKYKNDKDVHKQKVADFEGRVQEILKECKYGEVSDTEYVIYLYNYISKNCHIVTDASAVTCYDAIMNSKGSSFTYANMLEYFLSQADIPAYHILAEDAAGTGWGLSAAVIKSNLYYFDVVSEYYANGGNQLVYFGMTSADVNDEGLKNLKYSNQELAEDAASLDFDACRHCAMWKINDGKLLITRKDAEVIEISL